MTAADSESLGKGLSYEGRLPLAWSEAHVPSEEESHVLEHANLGVLRTLFVLETYSGELSDELPDLRSYVAAAQARLQPGLRLQILYPAQMLVRA